MELQPLYAVLYFIYGVLIGSFLNVCIFRLPLGEEVVKTPSHCMECGYRLKWYDLIPLISFLYLGGTCRECRMKLSVQYPLIELLNGILYLFIVLLKGNSIESLIYCLLASALLALSIIDFRTYEIPFRINIFIFLLGIIDTILDFEKFGLHLAGFFAVSIFFELLIIVSKGKAIGGGDMKLMAAAGLLIGWKLIILSFLLGCVIGSVIHIIRMKISNENHILALGPYLSIGIFLSVLWGEQWIEWYFSGIQL